MFEKNQRKIVQEEPTFLPTKNVFHSRAHFFEIKQEDNEAPNENWKKLVDIERKKKVQIHQNHASRNNYVQIRSHDTRHKSTGQVHQRTIEITIGNPRRGQLQP